MPEINHVLGKFSAKGGSIHFKSIDNFLRVASSCKLTSGANMSDATAAKGTATEVFGAVWDLYRRKTPLRVQLIDAYLVYVLVTGVIQFAYMLLVGTFPYNSFLAAFLSCVGVFVLTVSLRMQVNPVSRNAECNKWRTITAARAYADWLFCMLVLHVAVLNFLG